MSSPCITTGSSGDRILWVAASAVGLAAAAAILGGAMGDRVGDLWHWLHWIAKPLTTLMILGVALLARSAVSLRYRRWIVAGMACSLMGDILLMLPGDLFVAGLVAFLGGHVCFIKAFLSDRRVAVVPLAWLACLLVGAVGDGRPGDRTRLDSRCVGGSASVPSPPWTSAWRFGARWAAWSRPRRPATSPTI